MVLGYSRYCNVWSRIVTDHFAVGDTAILLLAFVDPGGVEDIVNALQLLQFSLAGLWLEQIHCHMVDLLEEGKTTGNSHAQRIGSC